MNTKDIEEKIKSEWIKRWQAKYEVHPQDLADIYNDLFTTLTQHHKAEVESVKKVLQEYYGYKSERDVSDGLAAVLEDWCEHAVIDAKNRQREQIRNFLESSSVWSVDYIYQRKALLLQQFDALTPTKTDKQANITSDK